MVVVVVVVVVEGLLPPPLPTAVMRDAFAKETPPNLEEEEDGDGDDDDDKFIRSHLTFSLTIFNVSQDPPSQDKKFAKMRLPCSEAIDSGWYCTPSMTNVLCLTPMMRQLLMLLSIRLLEELRVGVVEVTCRQEGRV